MSVPNQKEWENTFKAVFGELNNCKIHKTAYNSFSARNALRYTTKDEGMYKCESCERTWHSINALAEFEYRLSKDGSNYQGDVTLVLNGQSCKEDDCDKNVFIKPVFDEESIERILEKLLIKVKQKFYTVGDGENLELRYDALNDFHFEGSGSHLSEFCEGCKKGTCQSKATVPRSNYHRRKPYGRNTGMGSNIR